jgi:hypothetical protein
MDAKLNFMTNLKKRFSYFLGFFERIWLMTPKVFFVNILNICIKKRRKI